MKKVFKMVFKPVALMAVGAGLLLMGSVAYRAWAGTYTLLGSMVSVNGTNNGTAYAVGTIPTPNGTWLFQNGGLAFHTNDETVNLQVSIDNVNFVTVGVWNPATTNAGTVPFVPSFAPTTLYYRAQVITTNATQVGVTLLL